MNITITPSALASVGSADDGDPATGQPCNYSGAGRGRCNDGQALSAAIPATATTVTALALAQIGPAPTGVATSNAKGEATSTVRITYSFWERVLLFFGIKQQLSAELDLTAFAQVATGPNQATLAAFLSGGPAGTTNPIPVYQRAYNFDPQAANPATLDVKKEGAIVGNMPNGGFYLDTDTTGPTVDVEPGTYSLKFEANAVATSDGQVILVASGGLRLFEA